MGSKTNETLKRDMNYNQSTHQTFNHEFNNTKETNWKENNTKINKGNEHNGGQVDARGSINSGKMTI